MPTESMQRHTVTLGHRERGKTAQVWQGGSGTPVLLLHGAWAGARAHWSPVWAPLAERHTVIAPELPGFFPGSGEAKATYADLADWVAEVLRVLQCAPAVVIGNSFGACIAWHVAALHAPACRALVLVDGGPPPALPTALRWALAHTPLQRVARAQLLRRVFGPEALHTGFCDPVRAPEEIRRTLQTPDRALVDHLARMFIASRRPAARTVQPTLIVWGAQDRLPQSSLADGQRLQAQMPGSAFVPIPDAGHLPQVEQPQRFLQAVLPFIDGA